MGVGDTWGTREELLHPRDKNGRFRSKWKMAAGVVDAISKALAAFSPRMFSSDAQASQYLFNRRSRGKAGVGPRLVDFGSANQALRRGDMDPATKKFVQMMDDNKVTLPDDIIVSKKVTPEAFGLTRETMGLDDGGLEDFTGKLIADRGYSSTNIGTPLGQDTGVELRIAVPKGTQAVLPGTGTGDREVILDRDQEMRITKVIPNGRGGYYVMAVATDRTPGETPTPVGQPAAGAPAAPEVREAGVARATESQQGQMRIQSDTQVEAEAAERLRAQQGQGAQPVAGPAGPATVPAPPGTPPPRTEPVVSKSVGGTPDATPVPGAVPEGAVPAPEAPPTPRIVDLRQALLDAGIGAPARGRNRQAFNDAYLGVKSGKKDPADAIRELDADIEAIRRHGTVSGGRGIDQVEGEQREQDVKAMEGLRDLLREQYNLPAPAQETAPAAPATPAAPAAPKRRRGGGGEPVGPEEQARRGEVRRELRERSRSQPPDQEQETARQKAKDLAEVQNRKQAEQDAAEDQAVRSHMAPFLEAAGVSESQLGDLDKTGFMVVGNLLQKKKISRAEAARRLRTDRDSPLNKLADALQAQAGKRAAKKAAPTKAAPAKKAAPAAEGDDLDKMTKSELLEEARKRRLTGYSSKTKDQLKAMIRESGVGNDGLRKVDVPDAETVREMRVIPKSRVEGGDLAVWQPPGEVAQVGRVVDEGPRKKYVDWSEGRRESLGAAKGSTFITFHREAAPGDKVFIERGGMGAAKKATPAPAKKATKAAVPGAAPGTAAGKITATRLAPGTKLLVQESGDAWLPTNRKTGSVPVEVTAVERVQGGTTPGGRGTTRARIRITARGADGSEKQINSSPSQTFLVAPDAVPAKKAERSATDAGDPEQAARDRQGAIDNARKLATVAGELEEVIGNGGSDKAILSRMQAAGTKVDVAPVVRALEAGNRDQARIEMGRLMANLGVSPQGSVGDTVRFDPKVHKAIGQARQGDMVRIARPGHTLNRDGEKIQLSKATVNEVDEDVRPVPEVVVSNPRAEAPITNAPRKDAFKEAWDAAGNKTLQTASNKSMQEIANDISAGKITPTEGIRRLESDIAFNKEELADIDATLRGELDPKDRQSLVVKAAKLEGAIKAEQRASKFLRDYFRKETPTPQEVITVEVAPEVKEALERATADDLKRGAKEAGLPIPSGNTKEEVFKDLVRKIAAQELESRAAKKAAKKAPAKKAAPAKAAVEPGRLNAQLIAEGLDLGGEQDILNDVQRALDGEAVIPLPKNSSPAAIGRWVEQVAERLRSSTAIRYAGQNQAANAAPGHVEKTQRLKLAGYHRADQLQELANRLKNTRRPAKKALAKKAAPEVKVAEAKVEALESRILDDAVKELRGSSNTESKRQALGRLTMSEVRQLMNHLGVTASGRRRVDMIDALMERYDTPDTGASGTAGRATAESLVEHPLLQTGTEEQILNLIAPLSAAEVRRLASARSISFPSGMLDADRRAHFARQIRQDQTRYTQR